MLPESTCRKAGSLGFLIWFPSTIPKSTCSKHSVFDVFPCTLGFVGFRQALERCAFAAPCGPQDSSDLSVRNKLGFEVTREKKYRLLFHNGFL